MEKLVSQTAIKSDADEFYEIFRERLYLIAGMSSTNVKSVDLDEGEWGAVGSVISWNFTHDGKERVTKEIVEAIDVENKSVTFKVIESYLLELYKSFKFTVHVDANGDNKMVTWILEYEKVNEDVPDPQTLMDVCIALTKDIDTYYLNQNSNPTPVTKNIKIHQFNPSAYPNPNPFPAPIIKDIETHHLNPNMNSNPNPNPAPVTKDIETHNLNPNPAPVSGHE